MGVKILLSKIELYSLLSFAQKVFGPYTRKEDGRQIVIIQNQDGSRETVSYPKYVLEQHLGHKLDQNDCTVDHWDSNFLNNDISNLRIVPRKEHSADDTRRVKLVKFKCALCKNEFERSPRLVRDKAKKKKAGPFCSRKCAGKYARMLQLKLVDKFDVQPAVDSEYYKRKYITASIVTDDSFIDELCDIWEE